MCQPELIFDAHLLDIALIGIVLAVVMMIEKRQKHS